MGLIPDPNVGKQAMIVSPPIEEGESTLCLALWYWKQDNGFSIIEIFLIQ